MGRSAVHIVLLLSATALVGAGVLGNRKPGVNTFFLGTVEGKSYLAEMTPKRTWFDAKTYCTEAGMRLAAVETIAQDKFIVGVNSTQFQGEFWTAGRDAKSRYQFVWDGINATFSDTTMIVSIRTDILSCVLYSHDIKYLMSQPCSHTAGVLCESI